MQPTLRIDPADLGDLPLFDAAEARSMGISAHDLAILVRRGLLWRVERGWYSTHVDASEEERHVLRTVAALQLYGEESVACRHSAILLHGLPLARTDLSVVEIGKVNASHGRARRGVRVSRAPAEGHDVRELVDPIANRPVRVAGPARAIVGTALNNNPLGALVAADHAVRHGLCTHAQIEQDLSSMRGFKGVARARDALAHIDPRHESPGETLTADVLRRRPWDFDPQVKVVARGRRYRLDFALREHKVAIEFDGDIKYTDPGVMEAQLAREADLRAEGWVVVRITWEDLTDEAKIHGLLSAAVAEATRAQAA